METDWMHEHLADAIRMISDRFDYIEELKRDDAAVLEAQDAVNRFEEWKRTAATSF